VLPAAGFVNLAETVLAADLNMSKAAVRGGCGGNHIVAPCAKAKNTAAAV
jgi:hypothetical protein